jgi:DNA-binding NarL/FixJ family response regulator
VAALRVLLADDHPVFLDGLSLRLGQAEGLEVVATARSGEEAVAAAREQLPDVAVVDIEMPGAGGLEAIHRLREEVPGTVVLVLSMHEDDERVTAAMEAGAMGYVSKHAEPDEIVAAVRAVGAGQLLFGAAVAERMRDRLASPPSRRPFPQLTDREHRVLDLVARALDNRTIAGRLGISVKTVRNHVTNILGKMPARDRRDAIERARRAGLGR